MDRYKFLPCYHYVENEDGDIQNPATDKVRTCTIYGNHGKNLIPFPYVGQAGTQNGVAIAIDSDGVITLNGTATATIYFGLLSPVNSSVITKPGKYTISGMPGTVSGVSIQCYVDDKWGSQYKDVANGQTFTVTSSIKYVTIQINSGSVCDNVVIKPMLEESETKTAFEPWCGVGDRTRNILKYPYGQTTKTVNGIIFTDNGDGSITANGTATANANFYFILYESGVKINKKLFICGCPRGGSASAYSVVAALYKTADGTAQYVSSIRDVGDGAFLDCAQYDFTATELRIAVATGTICDNLTFKPMLIDLDARNLIPYPYARTTQTISGVTLTDNGDGSITVNGTATANVWYPISTRTASTIYATKGTYYLSGCPSGGSGNKYWLQCDVYNGTKQIAGFYDAGNGKTQDLSAYDITTISVNIHVNSGTTVDNLTFRPLLVNMDDISSYEPYGYKIPIKNQSDTTNIYTPKQIMQGESATFNEPFKLSKANQLSVETAVKPSAVKYTYYTY